ncbi:MAG: D-aminoacyl-tRNA deacylase [Christensenellales bacterium]|jgi:D-tyrosyl-tRNA(Tyr) deacylase
MRAVVQRVLRASVSIDGQTVSSVKRGFLALIGVSVDDTEADAEYIADKISGHRVFADSEGKMNLSILDIGGEVLAVSQFTLYGDCKKGRRPSFIRAAAPDKGERLYELVAFKLREHGIPVKTGIFGADMQVELINDGPVTILLDSEKTF